jgi:hypothetical protein
MSNPVCASYIAGTGLAVVGGAFGSSLLCKNPAIAAGGPAIATLGLAVLNAISANAASCALGDPICCGALATFVGLVGGAVSTLAVIHKVADDAYKGATVCGREWYSWRNAGANGEVNWQETEGNYRKCLKRLFLDDSIECIGNKKPYPNSSVEISNRSYREYIYGGIEFEDNGEGACQNPWPDNSAKRLRSLGYNSNNQRYYMTGPGKAPAFACHRFLSSNRNDKSAKAAYECCSARTKEVMCIERGDDHKFCKMGEKCVLKNVFYEVSESRKHSDYICARSYSVCPYNHPVGGGTEEKVFVEGDLGQIKNFCQYMNHCSKLPLTPFIRFSNMDGAYISKACKDLKGDSQNVYGYTAQLLPINNKGFTAPMAQCFKETLENIFFHRAGFTECNDPNQFPDEQGICADGYKFEEGESLVGDSFFVKMQNSLQLAIKLGVTMAVIILGIGVLFAVPKEFFTKKEIISFVIKISFVMYFAVGDGWQSWFLQGILDSSTLLAEITFRPNESPTKRSIKNEDGSYNVIKITKDNDATRLDGCQFPRYDYSTSGVATDYSNPKYPPGKSYLKIWDTIDCKLARALGFGPEASIPNIALMILAGFFTGGLGVVFFLAAFIFAFLLLNVAIKALHIFLMSILSIIILIYVSPITITAMLFKKTKGIFDGWWKQLLGYALQPMILFAYLGIFISIFDDVLIGKDVSFISSGKIEINGIEQDDIYGRKHVKSMDCSKNDARNTSVYCIFLASEISTWTGLKDLGIAIPILELTSKEKLQTIIKSALIMFVLMKFIDQISVLAAKLVGGEELKSDWNVNLTGKSYKALRGIQKRGMRVAMKVGGSVIRKGANTVGNFARDVGNKGKSTDSDSGKSGEASGFGGEGSSATGRSADGASGSNDTGRSADGASGSSGTGSSAGGAQGASGTGKSTGGTLGSSAVGGASKTTGSSAAGNSKKGEGSNATDK